MRVRSTPSGDSACGDGAGSGSGLGGVPMKSHYNKGDRFWLAVTSRSMLNDHGMMTRVVTH
jgi:hypothetical protein